jgi:hypothetical protein
MKPSNPTPGLIAMSIALFVCSCIASLYVILCWKYGSMIATYFNLTPKWGIFVLNLIPVGGVVLYKANTTKGTIR